MNAITEELGTLYHPIKALLLYRTKSGGYQESSYVESYDIGADGKPMNAHPLTVQEGEELIKALSVKVKKGRENRILNPRGLMPANVLYFNTGKNDCAVWRTPAQKVGLLFDKALNIPCGEAHVPPSFGKRAVRNSSCLPSKPKRSKPKRRCPAPRSLTSANVAACAWGTFGCRYRPTAVSRILCSCGNPISSTATSPTSSAAMPQSKAILSSYGKN